MGKIEDAAQLIFEARRDRKEIPRLSDVLRPSNKEDAMAIQQAVTALLQRPISGWKCAMPKEDRIPSAPIFDIYPEGRVPVLVSGNEKIVEPEIAFVLSRDLPPRSSAYTHAEILDSIGAARLAVEVIGSRFADFMKTDIHERVADHIVNESLVVGSEVDIRAAAGLEGFELSVFTDGNTLTTMEGKHPDGKPFTGLAWLVEHQRTGAGLRKGDVITTGSFAGFVEVPIGKPVRMQFGVLGSVDLFLSPA